MATGASALALIIPRRETGEVLAAFGSLLVGGLMLYCLDGGNLFDSLPLIRWRRSHHAGVPEIFSRRMFLSRAFTCHQLATAMDELLFPLLREREHRPIAALLLGVEEMFLDQDLRLAQRRYLFERILSRTSELARQGLPVLLTCGQSGPNPWSQRLSGQVRMLPDMHKALPALECGGLPTL